MPKNNPNTIPLETPIKRGENEITAITLNKPNSGALRGASLRGLLDFQTSDLITVLPRVSSPALTEAEAARLDPADLVQMGTVIAGFLLPKRLLAEAQAGTAPVDNSLPA